MRQLRRNPVGDGGDGGRVVAVRPVLAWRPASRPKGGAIEMKRRLRKSAMSKSHSREPTDRRTPRERALEREVARLREENTRLRQIHEAQRIRLCNLEIMRERWQEKRTSGN
jgi:hypothetical protein